MSMPPISPFLSTHVNTPCRTEAEVLQHFACNGELYFGDGVRDLPLPKQILQILNLESPFHSGYKIKDDHLLFKMPGSTPQHSITLDYLSDSLRLPDSSQANKSSESLALTQDPEGLPSILYESPHNSLVRYYSPLVKKELGGVATIRDPYWALITKGPIQMSRNLGYTSQLDLISWLGNKYHDANNLLYQYQCPTALEVLTSTFTKYLQKGEILYPFTPSSTPPWTFTHCQDTVTSKKMPLIVGGFTNQGIAVLESPCKHPMIGMAAILHLKE